MELRGLVSYVTLVDMPLPGAGVEDLSLTIGRLVYVPLTGVGVEDLTLSLTLD